MLDKCRIQQLCLALAIAMLQLNVQQALAAIVLAKKINYLLKLNNTAT
jgi:hypothetical protein